MPIDRNRYCLLLDYYGTLLTEHQYEVLDEYFNEDLSMNEIADNRAISKSAVQDLIRRAIKELDRYENSLALYEKDRKLDKILDEMQAEEDVLLQKYAEKIRKTR